MTPCFPLQTRKHLMLGCEVPPVLDFLLVPRVHLLTAALQDQRGCTAWLNLQKDLFCTARSLHFLFAGPLASFLMCIPHVLPPRGGHWSAHLSCPPALQIPNSRGRSTSTCTCLASPECWPTVRKEPQDATCSIKLAFSGRKVADKYIHKYTGGGLGGTGCK